LLERHNTGMATVGRQMRNDDAVAKIAPRQGSGQQDRAASGPWGTGRWHRRPHRPAGASAWHAAAAGMGLLLIGALFAHLRAGDSAKDMTPALITLALAIAYLAVALTG
jgi:hypothetical protein